MSFFIIVALVLCIGIIFNAISTFQVHRKLIKYKKWAEENDEIYARYIFRITNILETLAKNAEKFMDVDAVRMEIAVAMYRQDLPYTVSTGIGGSTTMGYGILNSNGYFEFSLPSEIVEKILKKNELDKAINEDTE